MRKTKIVATLGPASESEEILQSLVDAGVNIFRLNMSHSTHDWVRTLVPRLRALEKKAGRAIGILMDTQGPAIRTGDLPNKLELKAGDTFTFTVRGHLSEEQRSVDTNYDDLINDIQVGDTVLVDNGVIHMTVREKREKELVCEVLTPGTLGNRRHINLPGVRVNLPALTEKDIADVRLGVQLGVDFIALSFVREANDIELLRQVVHAENPAAQISLVAKIEDQCAIRQIGEIINAADAIMVARGDLGIEIPYEELPIVQRRIVKLCVAAGKPVIVATHMLESMLASPMPTRAEITDVANAVFEETDAVMLSGETSVGRYPLRCVEVLDRVARRIERSGSIGFSKNLAFDDERDQITASAVHLANQTRAAGMVVFTRYGRGVRVAAALRPRHTPIFAFAADAALVHRLTLAHAVYPYHLVFGNNPADTIAAAEDFLLQQQILPRGATLVVLTNLVNAYGTVRSVQLRRLGIKE